MIFLIDINECNDNATCAASSTCVNYNGTYNCACIQGYFASTSTTCSLCGSGTFTNVTDAPSCFACTPGTYTASYGGGTCMLYFYFIFKKLFLLY